MKKFSCLVVLFFVLCVTLPVFAEEDHDPLNTLDALNYAIVSIYRVEKYPSKVTVDEEYSGIINNIAWGNISADPELLNLFTEMMNAYTESRLDAKDREMLRKQYEVQVNRAFLEVRPISELKKEATAKTASNAAQSLSSGGSFWQVAGGLVGAGISGGAEYIMALQAHDRMKMQAQGQEQEFMQQRMAGEWELDKARIRRFNTLKTSLLNAVWPLLNRYNLPDEARITEENLDQFYAFIAEKDMPKALRMGKRLETNFSQYPPFWFYLGSCYLQNGDMQEARHCFDKFEEVNRPILRKDAYAASSARYKIFTLERNEYDEAGRLLGVMEKQSPSDDWNNILFAALQYYQLGDKNKAEDLLYQNIDNGHNVDLNKEMLRQMQKGELDLSAVQAVSIRQFNEPSELEKLAKSGNAEAQYAYGRSMYLNNKKQGLHWLKLAADQGHFYAQCELASREPEKYEKEAKSLFEELKTESESSSQAQFYLAKFYAAGAGTTRDERQAFQWYQKAAEQGYAWAQTSLGNCYYNGNGTDKDMRQAFQWYQKAAEQGLAWAQTNLGNCYLKGTGTARDVRQAFQWYQKAAEQGDARAQTNLGVCYEYGNGTDKDMRQAFQWYQKAAEQGYAPAQTNLGVCYANGTGTAKDVRQAFQWYQKAAEQGDARAQTNLGVCYKYGNGTDKDMRQAFQWYQKAAEQGYAPAQTNLGVCYANGTGTAKDVRQAFQWYQKAAEQGYARAQSMLGFCYYDGKGTAKDVQQAFQWFQRAAEQGLAEAQFMLGFCYYDGKGTAKDVQQAFQWYQKAAEQGLAEAQMNLGVCYEYGDGTAKDERQAFQWYQKAAEQGLAEAQTNLGNCYLRGIGTAKDERQAFQWFQKAAEQGDDARAQTNLGDCYYNGTGTARDERQAFLWYQRAATQGYTNAQLMLGFCYEDGIGAAKNKQQAFLWYRDAARQGNAVAQYNLGRCYAKGIGTAKDKQNAFQWYKKAAEQGNTDAQKALKKL